MSLNEFNEADFDTYSDQLMFEIPELLDNVLVRYERLLEEPGFQDYTRKQRRNMFTAMSYVLKARDMF